MIEYERHDLTGVPDYRAAELEAKRSDYCLLIPVINEGARILTELGPCPAGRGGQAVRHCDLRRRFHDGSMKPDTLAPLRREHAAHQDGPRQTGRPAADGHLFCAEPGL